MLLGVLGLVFGSGGLLGWVGVLRGLGVGSFGRKAELWSFRVFLFMGLWVRKLVVAVMILGWVVIGFWD